VKKLTRRTFFKGLFATAIIGTLLPWFRKSDTRSYPLNAYKEPRAVPRSKNA